MARFTAYREHGELGERNRLIEEHLCVAHQEARRFRCRGEPIDDLMQVARLGLVKAVERYDPAFGIPFTAFARPTIAGELRRHFRDCTWSMRVPRRMKDLHVRLGRVTSELTHELGRSPVAAELAGALHCGIDETVEAIHLGSAYRPATLDALGPDDASADPPDDGALREFVGSTDRVALRQLLVELPVRERSILYLRYFCELSQSEIAERIGMSQVHVSRLLRASLGVLREQLHEVTGDDSPTLTERTR